jgi:hypothetical protein
MQVKVVALSGGSPRLDWWTVDVLPQSGQTDNKQVREADGNLHLAFSSQRIDRLIMPFYSLGA